MDDERRKAEAAAARVAEMRCIPHCNKRRPYVMEHFPECDATCRKYVKGWREQLAGKSRRKRRRKTRR